MAVVVALVGCSKPSGPPLAQAKGVVMLGGKPVDNARVMFYPIDQSSSFSHGTTDAEGRFTMSTRGANDGALVGRHKVVISKVDMPEQMAKVDVSKAKSAGYGPGSMPGYESMMGIGGAKPAEAKQEIPAKYSNKETTVLEIEVVTDATQNEYTFNLDQ
ncbi:MAG: transthyretin-like family protein [Pirellulaceae bacterium]|nr:transthyretin-like family protein [Pirellulaceae bacterium]